MEIASLEMGLAGVEDRMQEDGFSISIFLFWNQFPFYLEIWDTAEAVVKPLESN